MSGRMIEVAPEGEGWTVKLSADEFGRFDAQAQAVAFACSLADQVAGEGPQPRIMVQFEKGWRA